MTTVICRRENCSSRAQNTIASPSLQQQKMKQIRSFLRETLEKHFPLVVLQSVTLGLMTMPATPIDQSVHAARSQAQQLHVGSRSLMAGLKAAWLAWQKPAKPARKGARKATKYSPEGRNLRSRPPTSNPPTAARSHDSSGRSLQAPPDSQLPSSKFHSADQLPSVPPPMAQKTPVKPLPEPQQEASDVGQAAESGHEVVDAD